MKVKKDCKECGSPLKDWQAKQGFDLCLECYNSNRTKKMVKAPVSEKV